MIYYVMSEMGIEEEFDNFEEADNYIDMNGDPSMLWIVSGEGDCEDDFEPSYNEDEGFDPYMGSYSWDC